MLQSCTPPSRATIYHLAGAAVGVADGAAAVGGRELAARRAAAARRTAAALHELQRRSEERAAQLVAQGYTAAGACAGLYAGSRYAVLSLWWWLTENDIKIKLLKQGSPIKYQLLDIDADLFEHYARMHRRSNNSADSGPPSAGAGSSRASSRAGSRPPSIDLSAARAARGRGTDSPRVLAA